MKCKICDCKSTTFASAKILNAYKITYYQCERCGFVQTEEPYWLEEAYLNPINTSDTGIMARNSDNVSTVSAVLHLCLNPDSQYADYGGGYGIFVRMMRDRGFDFYCDDKYCPNLFANLFNVANSGISRFELVTAFEVFEHFVSPCKDLQDLLQLSDNILFTTEILPYNSPHPSDWWYYGLDHGQHISFFTRKALQCMANKFGLDYYYRNNIHLFTRKKANAMNLRFQLALRLRFSKVLKIFLRKKTLVYSDYKQITGMDIR
jgi:hypothetical protein